jgi:hypothetical protein
VPEHRNRGLRSFRNHAGTCPPNGSWSTSSTPTLSGLLDGSLTYEKSLRDYFPALLAAQGGDAGAIWSIDGVHLAYV